jgi:hypothetical protein
MGPPGPRVPAPPTGPPLQTPPQGGRHRTAWILVAVGAVVVVGVVLAVVLGHGSSGSGGGGGGGGGSNGGSVNMQITASLDTSHWSEADITVSSAGQEVGQIQVDESTPEDTLQVTSPAGSIPYTLDVQLYDLDDNQISCEGRGTVDAEEGATLTIVTEAVGSSGCAASLEKQ